MAGVAAAILKGKPTGGVASTSGCTGVTTFIKTELIANGIGRACVPRIGGDRNGIKNGQKVDHELQVWAKNNGKTVLRHAGSRHIVAGLNRLRIKPLKAQVRVTDPDRKLTTLIDLVGVGPNDTLWVIEIKATTLTTENHNKSYSRPCSRTHKLKNALPHTEQSTHLLQAAFGALTLRKNYSVGDVSKVRAVVLVATTDSCRTYVCPPAYMHARLFDRRQAVPVQPKSRALTRGTKNQRVSREKAMPTAPWPAIGSKGEKQIDAVLAQLKLCRFPGRRRSVFPVRRRGCGKIPVGIVALTPIPLLQMTKSQRGILHSVINRSANRLLANHPRLMAAARLAMPATAPTARAVLPCPGPLSRSR